MFLLYMYIKNHFLFADSHIKQPVYGAIENTYSKIEEKLPTIFTHFINIVYTCYLMILLCMVNNNFFYACKKHHVWIPCMAFRKKSFMMKCLCFFLCGLLMMCHEVISVICVDGYMVALCIENYFQNLQRAVFIIWNRSSWM